tara:strand:- start:1665 stop:2435 length:771 start_codon:yes stop_codon:yes gene_type:complete
MIKIILVIIVLGLGLYFIAMNSKISTIENFEGDTNSRCPNMLIERENNYFLYNSKLAIVPGVNPIRFNNLEEYTEFIEWQRGQGINCPVLQLQYSTDPQNNDVYKIKPNIFENQGGLPNSENSDETNPQPLMSSNISKVFDANVDDPPFNQGEIFSFDPNNQYIGLKTPIDLIGFQGDKSPNPMDSNWGGIQYTKTQIGTTLNPNSDRLNSQSTVTTQLTQNNISISKDKLTSERAKLNKNDQNSKDQVIKTALGT